MDEMALMGKEIPKPVSRIFNCPLLSFEVSIDKSETFVEALGPLKIVH